VVTELAVVMPFIAVHLPLKGMGTSLDGVEVFAHAVFRRLDVRVSVQRVVTARCPEHLAVLVVADPHKLSRGDVLEHGSSLRKLELLAAILARDQLPCAQQLILRLCLRDVQLLGSRACKSESERNEKYKSDLAKLCHGNALLMRLVLVRLNNAHEWSFVSGS